VPVYIPIVSEFKSDGIQKAAKEFKSLEGASAKASFAIKKAALPAAAALAGLGVAAVDAAKAAAEDAAAAEKLAGTLRNTTNATDAQIASVEEYISKTSVAAAVADDELRPALQTLVTGTKDVAAAQDLLGLALDISAATGKDLETVSMALAKGYNGQNTALKKLDPSLGKLIKDGASTEEVFAALSDTFGGQAAAAAGTAEGKMKSLSIALGEAKESFGAALLPVITALAEKLTGVAGFVQENSTLMLTLAAIVGTLAAAIITINTALTVYKAVQAATIAINTLTGASFSALWVATGVGIIVAVIAALVVLQAKFNIFGRLIDTLKRAFSAFWDLVKAGARGLADVFRAQFNRIAQLWNNTVGAISFTVPDWVPVIGGKGFDVPDIPMLAAGGIVTSPTLAMVGEAGPEAVIPLNRLASTSPTVNVTVNGALDPVKVAAQIRQLLQDDARRRGATFAL
jgi:hypothetical protein